jgi:radical SAM enzyme (TIGR04100 family)
MTILYQVHSGLYVNMTNRCPCDCTFCLRNTRDEMDASGSLWLEHDPTVDEVKAEFRNFPMETYSEVVFCGFGEPTERIFELLEVASFVKETYHKKVRINTNGLGNLIHKQDITPLFEGKIDCVSISLNTPNAKRYNELTRSIFGEQAFSGMLDFADKVKHYVQEVVMTTVATTISEEEEQECQAICDKLGVQYRIRAFED